MNIALLAAGGIIFGGILLLYWLATREIRRNKQ